MPLSIQEIAKVLGLSVDLPFNIREIAFDSRRILDAESTLFVALEGKRDGHDFLEDALQSGVKSFLVKPGSFLNAPKEVAILEHENPLTALQKIASHIQSQRKALRIGITGSNGKTVVKEWLYHLLKELYAIGRSPKSYNSQLGVPLSIWQLPVDSDMDILEAGISKKGEMSNLESMIKPQLGILTSFGRAHDAGFASNEEKLLEKLELFKTADALIYPAGNPWLKETVESWAKNREITLIGWQNTNPKGDHYIACSTNESLGMLEFQEAKINIPFSDKASLDNACTCLMVLDYLRKNPRNFTDGFLTLPSIDMRLQLLSGKKGSKLINDAYSADLNSLEIALDFLEKQAGKSKRVLVLSDLKESGKNDAAIIKELKIQLKKHPVDLFIGVGQALLKNQPSLGKTNEFFPDTESAAKELFGFIPDSSTVLIKGGREYGFERLARILEDQVHETALEIDLNALEHNFSFFRKKLKKSTKIMGMVKAFAYGSGSFEIAQVLQSAGADYLSVAYAVEGIALRKRGVSLPILVLNPQRDSLEEMLDFNLEPDIYDFDILQRLIDTLHETGIPEARVHLEFDTGMHRLGFQRQDLSRLFAILERNPGIVVKSVFAHLAAGDDKQHDSYTYQQLADFQDLKNQIITFLKYKPLFHILNTAGASRFAEAEHEMVRLGIGLYGVEPSGTVQDKLLPVGKLTARISQIRSLKAGSTVGYSRKGLLEKDSEIAVISLGYADGFRRELSNGKGHIWVNGRLAPVIGNVCMDMTMIDVSHVPCKVGDQVEIFGTNRPIHELAAECNTIPYEILTGISERVKRIYWKE